MFTHVPPGAAGLSPGAGAQQSPPPFARKHHAVRHRAFQPGSRLHLSHGPARAQQDNATDSYIKRLNGREGGPEHGAGSGLDVGSVFRSVFDFSNNSSKANAAAPAAAAAAVAGAARPAAAAALDAAAYSGSVPAGPFAATPVASAGSLAEQVLTSTSHSAVQDDPVAAARQLQLFLSQYRDQYGPETDARISAAVAKLQDYIQGYSGQGGSGGLEGGAAAAAAAAAADGSSGEGVVYHNYILEQLTGILDWVNNLLVNNNPKPYVFDAYGRVLDSPAAAVNVEQQQEQLRAASNSLRVLIQQLQQVNRQYAAMADPDEKAAMGQVLSQLTTMADRLAVAATRRPLPPSPVTASATTATIDATATNLAPYVRPEELYGAEKYRDPLLRVLDGVYQAVVVDSGLREFLAGIKQLGDSLVASMAVAWTGAPPIGRLIAYIAAVAGVVFVMRTRLPASLLAPTKIFGHLGAGNSGSNGGGNGSGSGNGSEPGTGGAVATNPAAAAAFATIANGNGDGNGQAAAAAAAAAFAAIAANGGGRGPLASLDRDAGLGDTRLPSEILASNDPYAARSALIDAQVTPVGAAVASSSASTTGAREAAAAASGGQAGGARRSGGSGLGNGWATLTGAAAAPASAASSSSGAGLFTSPSFPGGPLPRTPSGGWTSQYSDRADWWALGTQQQQRQQQQQAASPAPPSTPTPPPPPPPPPAPRAPTVAESWEAFRLAQSAGEAGVAAYGGGGMLDTTAALAAAAVAAAAVGDPKMAELARATEERRLSKDRARLRATIKDRLRWVCLALGPVSSVVPGGEPLREEVDGLLAQLEALSPTDKPLNTVVDVARRPTVAPPIPLVDPLLLGEWRLVYASNASATAGAPSAASQAAGGGPNLLAQILHIADSLPGFGMTHVVQRLSLESAPPPQQVAPRGAAASVPAPSILTENSAVFRFGPLGSWRVSVRGRWVDDGGGLCAAAEFESFSVRPVELWGLPVSTLLPEVAVPVPEVLRSRSEWCTTYLDEEMRVGRGSGGALFLFKRGGDAAEGVEQQPQQQQQQQPAAAAAAAAAVAAQQPVMRPL